MSSAPELPEDLRRLLAEVCAEHRVRIDPDDPAVAIVMLNKLVLELVLERSMAQLQAATAEMLAQVNHFQVRAGATLAQELRAALRNGSSPGTIPSPGAVQQTSGFFFQFAAVTGLFVLGLLAGILVR